MFPANQKTDFHTRRFIGTALLLAVFLLPLHFHAVNALPLINKDCSCYSGTRTQLGLPHAEIPLAPVIQAYPVVDLETYFPISIFSNPHPSRAPPAL